MIRGTVTLCTAICFSPLNVACKMLSKYILHMARVYLHLHLEMTLRSPKSHTLAEGIFPLFTRCKIMNLLAALSESHHDVLFQELLSLAKRKRVDSGEQEEPVSKPAASTDSETSDSDDEV